MYRTVLDSVGEGEGGMMWENGIESCTISYKGRITSLGSMQGAGCFGLVHWDDTEEWWEWAEVRGGFGIGNTYTPMADSC